MRVPGSLQQSINRNRVASVGEVTLTANATTTVVPNLCMAAVSHVFLTPYTSNAAAAIGTTYISSRGFRTFTITHANNAQTDRTFGYEIVAGDLT